MEQKDIFKIFYERYDNESDLLMNVMCRAIRKFNISSTQELAITCEVLDNLNDWPEAEGYGWSDWNYDLERVEEALEHYRKHQKEVA